MIQFKLILLTVLYDKFNSQLFLVFPFRRRIIDGHPDGNELRLSYILFSNDTFEMLYARKLNIDNSSHPQQVNRISNGFYELICAAVDDLNMGDIRYLLQNYMSFLHHLMVIHCHYGCSILAQMDVILPLNGEVSTMFPESTVYLVNSVSFAKSDNQNT